LHEEYSRKSTTANFIVYVPLAFTDALYAVLPFIIWHGVKIIGGRPTAISSLCWLRRQRATRYRGSGRVIGSGPVNHTTEI